MAVHKSLFPRIARVKPGEYVVFSWITYKSIVVA